MAISYTYEVKSVNEESNYMEVEYTADGFDPITVGTQIPTDQDDINYFIDAFAPYGVWMAATVVKTPPPIGTKGSLSQAELYGEEETSNLISEPSNVAEAKVLKIKEIYEWKNNKRESFVVIDSFVVKPNQRYLSNLKCALDVINIDERSTVNYKFADDVYKEVDAETLSLLINKLTVVVQDMFDDEKAKIDEVNSLTTIEEVMAYSPSLGMAIPNG